MINHVFKLVLKHIMEIITLTNVKNVIYFVFIVQDPVTKNVLNVQKV